MNTKTESEETVPDFMTAAEVADWLRVGLSTVYAWTATDRIPYLKFNGVLRFQRDQLRGWMQHHTSDPSASAHLVPEHVSEACPRPLTPRTMVEAAARVRRRLLFAKKPIHHGGGQ